MIRYAIAGLFVVAMVGVAYADHKPNHNPGGGGEPPAPTPQVLVVRDGDKNFVGEFAGRSSQDQGFLVTYRGDPAEDIFFETFPRIALAIFTGTVFGGHNTFGVTADVIYWTETGCTGTPYIQANRSGDLPNILGLPRLVARDTILGAVAYKSQGVDLFTDIKEHRVTTRTPEEIETELRKRIGQLFNGEPLPNQGNGQKMIDVTPEEETVRTPEPWEG